MTFRFTISRPAPPRLSLLLGLHLWALALLLSAPTSAQSMNFDLGQAAGLGQPQAGFGGAAGQPGLWNYVLGTQGLFGNFVDVNSNATVVDLSVSTGTSGRCQFSCTGAQPDGSDNDVLMDDYCRFNGTLNLEVRNLLPGHYSVYVYAWAPDQVQARTKVYGEDLGGAWPANNQQMLNRTYTVKHNVPVARGTAMKIKLEVGVSVGTLNGLQIVHTSSTIGTSYCPTVPNSTGDSARMIALGSDAALENFLYVSCTNMPENSFCLFITSQTPAAVPAAGMGYLCVGGAVARGVGGQIFHTGSDGFVTTAVDLTAHPTPTGTTSVQPGETWYIQCWMRDAIGGVATSNTSDGVGITFI